MPSKSGLLSRSATAEQLHGVRFTHPDRVVFDEQGITKRDLGNYYIDVADWILPQLVNRPLSLVRCPNGVKGPCFFQKQPPQGLPKNVKHLTIRFKEGDATGLYVEDLDGLLALVQFGVLEVHVWQSQADAIERPDRMIFDLDPGPKVDWPQVIGAALLLRDLLKELSLASFVKTSGGKGLHVVVPLDRQHTWAEVKAFSKAVAGILANGAPDQFTLTMSKAARPGKIFIDYLRNERGATTVCAYSTRARRDAPVSLPLPWRELRKCPGPASFTVTNTPQKLNRRTSDPWQELASTKQSLTAAARKRLGLK